ncbi:hypothetical protein F5Y17DRAFT_351466 [Xylariaceae sp. FL0594]|nr:hypothetical protein F5Y17DRAFT_351466 [Xylariaceae sp. FL0594]
MVCTPSRRGSQTDLTHTALSSPSRASQASPSRRQQVPSARSYSPASNVSSGLSTLYSEEEGSSPLTSTSRFASIAQQSCETDKGAAVHPLRSGNALNRWPTTSIVEGKNGEADNKLVPGLSPRSLHIRKGTLGQGLPPGIALDLDEWTSLDQEGSIQTGPWAFPRIPSTFTLRTPSIEDEDPFAACSTPVASQPRLSQFFTPLPAELPGNRYSPVIHVMEPSPQTPTRSSSHKRVVPPPYRLQPSRSSPTLGQHEGMQLQTQPPSRAPSPAPSEGGLSSVYDSYWYSRYSDSLEGSHTLAQLSTTTSMLTVANVETSPRNSRWSEDTVTAVPIDGQAGGKHPAAHTYANSHSVLPIMVPGSANQPSGKTDVILRSKGQRENSFASVSDISAPSAYSLEAVEEGDQLAPLNPTSHAQLVSNASRQHSSRAPPHEQSS